MELPSGGKPLPKRQSRRPDSIRSVHDHSIPPHGFVTAHDGIQLSDPFATAKRQRVQTSAPQPESSNVSRIKMASESKLVKTLWIQVSMIFLGHSTFLQDFHWHSICISSRVDPWSLSDVGLADLLNIHKLARRSDGQGPGVSVTLKALRWTVSHLQVKCLGDCVYGSIVSSFGKQRSSADRRETLPFSLFILCMWEKTHIVQGVLT